MGGSRRFEICALWNKWYLIFTFFLIGNGLFHDYFVAMRLNSPDMGDMLRLQDVLREFPKIPPTGVRREIPPSAPDDEEA
jgi:hypothetical protein